MVLALVDVGAGMAALAVVAVVAVVTVVPVVAILRPRMTTTTTGPNLRDTRAGPNLSDTGAAHAHLPPLTVSPILRLEINKQKQQQQ